jgi:hypothetical protein
MPTSPRHGFQKWSSGFTQSDVILNADIDMLDVRVALSVRSRTENAPLGGDVAGDCYIITGTPSGAFSAFTENNVVFYDGSTWYEFEPVTGQVAWVEDDAEGVTFDGSAWTVTSADLSTYATQAYVNAALVGLVDLKGDYDASTNTPDLDTSPSGILKGDAWECSVAGTFFTFDLNVGDIVVAKQDDPTTEAHWIINKEGGEALDQAEVDARVKLRTEAYIAALGDESTAITTGTAKVTFRMPYALNLTEVRASVVTAPTGAAIIVDINESGSTVLSTKLSIDATEKTSTTATAPAVISDAALADDAEITIDIDQVGSTIAGAGLKITLIGNRP